jgi:DNA-binding NarL/FixJ family response regulator
VKTALPVRHEAALFLLQRGQLEPEEALAAVVWPKSERLDEEGLERVKEWPAQIRDEGLRLFDSGLTKREVGQLLGVCESTVKGWLATRSKWAKRQAAA